MKARTYMLDGRPVPVVISDEAIKEWEEVREINKVSGYPDRPPDYDTPTIRGWALHPGDTGYGTTKPDSEHVPYESLVSTIEGQLSIKFLAATKDGGQTIEVRVRFEQEDGTFNTHSEYEMPLAKWEEMKATVTGMCKAMGGHMMYTSPQDYEDMTSLREDVDKAIADWYRENAGNEYADGVH